MPEDVKPEDVVDDLNQNAKDQKEFNDVFEELFEGEEMSEKEVEPDPNAVDKDKDAALGEGTKDPDPEPVAKEPVSTPKEGTDDPNVSDNTDSNPDATFWINRARQLEADLVKEQQRTKSWDGRIGASNKRAEEAESKVKSLEAQLAEKGTESSTNVAPTNDAVEQVLTDFPEIKPIVDKFTGQLAKQQEIIDGLKQKDAGPKVDTKPEPAKATPKASEEEDARKIIVDAHPDFKDVMASGKLEPWISKQPEHIKPRLEEIYRTGTAAEVVSMTTTFKKETGWKPLVSQDNDNKKNKLDSMKEVTSEGSGPPSPGPDKEDFDAAAKEIGL